MGKIVRELIDNHTFFNADTNEGMQHLIERGIKVDFILTSPPYNAHRSDFYNGKTKINDSKTPEEHTSWLVSHFKQYDKLLKKNGVVIYNLNYMSSKKNNVSNIYKTMLEVEKQTPFIIIDVICWKKKSGIPSREARLTRVWEHVFILIRKDDWQSFHDKKCKILTGKPNFIEAPNNDFVTNINKACFSSELVVKLLKLYGANKKSIVLDNFMGTGTTSIGCEKIGCFSIGIEIDETNFEFSLDRMRAFKGNLQELSQTNLFNFYEKGEEYEKS